jgi:hypothetical protein
MQLVLDDTWFIRPSTFETQWTLDPKLFPGEAGPGTPGAENWTAGVEALVTRTKAAGWAGLGLWHHGILMAPKENSSISSDKPFSELGAQFQQLAAAGVQHIKVDGTDLSGNVTQVSKWATGGAVRIEHKRSPGAPINGKWAADGRCTAPYILNLADLASRTDVLRTDDIVCQFSVPTCLDRFSRTLAAIGASPAQPAVAGSLGVIAPQDEAYMAAALGGSLAGMRHPLPQLVGDTRINGNRNLTRRVTEVTRSMRWGHIAPAVASFCAGSSSSGGGGSGGGGGGSSSSSAAPPRPPCYPTGRGAVLVDGAALTDHMVLSNKDTWFSAIWGKPAYQGAPARTARDLPHLPHVVEADARYPGVSPFVVASRHPGGAFAVAALGRTLEALGGWVMPLANVTLFAPPLELAPSPSAQPAASIVKIGAFGRFGALTVAWASGDLDTATDLIWMQDLAGDLAVDVTDRISVCANGSALFVPGSLIDSVTAPGPDTGAGSDLSDPGVVIVIERQARRGAQRSTSARTGAAGCPVIPAPDPPSPPPTPSPPAPPSPGPAPPAPIAPQEFNGTWAQASPNTPHIDIVVTNGGGDVSIVGHDAGRWSNGTGVVLNDVLDVHCFGPGNFTTHQVGTGSRTKNGGLQLTWVDGPTGTGTNSAGGGPGPGAGAPRHWAVWKKLAV